MTEIIRNKASAFKQFLGGASRRSFLGRLFAGLGGMSVAAAGASRVMAEPSDEQRGTEPFIGEITMFGGNFAPRGWAFCNGQLLAVSANNALFSLLGTTYGGDGRTSFGLPDLRGRTPIHKGDGHG